MTWKGLATVGLVLACIAYTEGLAVMSVDLGNEFMKIAIVKPGVPMEIALNKESRRKTAVVVTMRNGERTFSDPAIAVGSKAPKTMYWYILDLLGKQMDNPQVDLFRKRFPYYDLEADPDTGLVVFKHDEETKFTVEELMAMILEHAKQIAESFAEQPISEAVLTVPPYFNQAERRALIRAGELAGLKVLQLLNDNTAVALNYGVFRMKSFNGTAVHYMFFDMGSHSTTATIASYQVVKSKSPVTGIEEIYPQLTVRGVGFDRTLGGLEFQLRLRNHLAALFNKMQKGNKVGGDVTENGRAMQKLFKEAGRLKQVLSANADHFAQVESLVEDSDFRAKVTRTEFEEMCSDLFTRVEHVVKDALKVSEITMEEISEVILMGGGTRVPKIQEMLRKVTGRDDLGKSVNTDEAAALGASYQAAHLSKGYKVKKFNIKDANLYPIQVEFERVRLQDDNPDASKVVKRTLFGRMNPFPQKKVMTFNKHTKDFGFNVNYGELGFLSDEDRKVFGSTHLKEVSLSGVEDAQAKHKDTAESKGIKAHFKMDDSGCLTLDKVEALFEKQVEDLEEEKEESTLSKIGNTISNLFGGGDDKTEDKEGGVESKEEDDKTEEVGGDTPSEKPEESENEQKTEGEKEESQTDAGADGEKEGEDTGDVADKEPQEADEEKQEEKAADTEGKEPTKEEEEGEAAGDSDAKDAKPEEKGGEEGEEKVEEKVEEKKVKSKPVTVKEEIKSTVSTVDTVDPSDSQLKVSRIKIAELRARDEEKSKLERVRNELEGFIVDTLDRLDQKPYIRASTEAEREAVGADLAQAQDWLYEQDDTTERKAFETKLKALKKAFKDVADRVKEHEERPRAMEALNSIVNYTQVFLDGMKNFTGEDLPFTEVEIATLGKLINETKEWNVTITKEQQATALHDKPKLLVEDIAKKIGELDREVKYLVNKVKTFRPKPKKAANKTEEAGTGKKTNKTEAEEPVIGEGEGEAEGVQLDPPTPDDSATPPQDTDTPEAADTEAETQTEKETEEKEEEETLQIDDGATAEDTKSVHDPNDEL